MSTAHLATLLRALIRPRVTLDAPEVDIPTADVCPFTRQIWYVSDCWGASGRLQSYYLGQLKRTFKSAFWANNIG